MFIRRIKENYKVIVVLAGVLIASAGYILAQGFGYFPQYPTRISSLAKELSLAMEDLEYLNENIQNQAKQCACSNSESSCQRDGLLDVAVGVPKVFGETCKNRMEIENTQVEIQNTVDQVGYLRNLLIAEMQSGLNEELQTLREDDAARLKASLDKILSDSGKAIPLARNNAQIFNDPRYSSQYQCQPNCSKNPIMKFKACILIGQQEPIRIRFGVSAGLEDLDLGVIGLSGIRLNLPDYINLGNIAGAGDINIVLPQLNLVFPPTKIAELGSLSLDPIVFHPSSPSIPNFGESNLSCPSMSYADYSCAASGIESENYKQLQWYLQTFSWLSERCQEIPGQKDDYGLPTQERFEKCFDKTAVQSYIVQQCDGLWEKYTLCFLANTLGAECPLPTGICEDIKRPSLRNNAIHDQCIALFSQVQEPAPTGCGIQDLENKCQAIKEEGLFDEVPEPCRLLPVFNQKLILPDTETHQSSAPACNPQTIINNPRTMDLYCPDAGFKGSIPGIKLPDIIIPDLKLPTYNFSPFVKVKLPNFIFEDLIFSKMNFCDINNCMNLIPSLTLTYQQPHLRIPSIHIPSIYLDLPDIPGFPEFKGRTVELKMNDIQFPDISLGFPDFDLKNLVSLEMDMPKIETPRPKITLNFEGFDFNVANLLLGLVSSILPIPSGCISGGISFIPIVISFPDYYFYWPRFPEMPDICQNVNNFCQVVRTTLEKETASRIGPMEKLLNNAVYNGIQKRLDQAALVYRQMITDLITKRMYEIKGLVENGLQNSFLAAVVREGLLYIPDTTIPLGDIKIPMSAGNYILSQIPTKIYIPWTNDLKEIKLKNIIGFDLPTIPLSNLSYTKNIELRVPGLQLPSLSFNINFLGEYASFESNPPSGGNPYPLGTLNQNTTGIKTYSGEIHKSMEEISDVLD